MDIYQMYGKLAELQETTEEARAFLYGLVLQLKSGAVKPSQLETLEGGGFRVKPRRKKPEPKPTWIVEVKEPSK